MPPDEFGFESLEEGYGGRIVIAVPLMLIDTLKCNAHRFASKLFTMYICHNRSL